ncbi:MAG: hypothetical protein IPL21_11230 [Saprospirales bacterium]|nr:hypothetical protein [Saprospirales bacterium]
MKNNIQLSTKLIAAFMLLSGLILSCKKNEKDDPNITYKTFNKSVTSQLDRDLKKDSIDINGDGSTDMFVLAVSNEAADTSICYLSGTHAYMYIDSTQTYFITYKLKNMASGQQPALLSTKTEWYNIVFAAVKATPNNRGFAGVGDVYIPIIFLDGANKHYGWIRLNVSSDYRTIKVIDGAYHITPDTPIKMGDK